MTGTLDDHGAVQVPNLPAAMSLRPVVKITHAGVDYITVGEPITGPGSSQLNVPVYETTDTKPDWSIQMWHVMVRPEAAGVRVPILVLNNPADRAWTGGTDKTTLSLPLPKGASEVQFSGAIP